MRTVVTSTDILLLADGESPGAMSNARGHLFEEFVANFVALFGYQRPSRSALNVTSNGIELDVTSRHELTSQRMIAECKAYTSPLTLEDLAAFYGKLGAERFSDRDLFGYFVAVPRLTKEGQELAAKIEANDSNFRVYTSDGIVDLLISRGTISRFVDVAASYPEALGRLSDDALLVTMDGLFYAAHELDSDTRLPQRVVAFPCSAGRESVPPRVVMLLKNATSYTKGLPCVATSAAVSARPERDSLSEDAIIEVSGSSSDFEYQFPAAPQFFVGRQNNVSTSSQVLRSLGAPGCRSQVMVFNAQSGWGKSSLALKVLAEARALGGDGVCIDCRTATHPTFVSAAFRRGLLKARDAGVVVLSESASFATVASTLQTLRSSSFTANRPVCIFFDQFENVFQNQYLTREFRDLALGIVDISAPILIGFSWKTDFVAFTENYPYQLRDDIRSRAIVVSLTPFGPSEIGELISRLQKSCGQKLHLYLRERIREYSQGLPWLFKKLGSHIIREIGMGTTQDELLSEVLNIQSLFESDVSCLNVGERQALKSIARRAPLPVLEAVELAEGNRDVLQSLLNQRLLVPIGERLDVYWDVFRDYLNHGTVPLQESYVMRLTPNSVRKLLITIRNAGGVTSPDDAARSMNSSVISVLNMARELRQLGVLAAREGVLQISDDLVGAVDLNAAVATRAAGALKRHRVYSLLKSIAPADGRVAMPAFTAALPKAYPAVDAKKHTWVNYSRAFAHWFHFAGLATIERDEIIVGQQPSTSIDLTVPGKQRVGKGIAIFPRSPAGPVFALLRDLADSRPIVDSSGTRKALGDAKLLAFVEQGEHKAPKLTRIGLLLVQASEAERRALVRNAIKDQTAFRIGYPMLEGNPATSPVAIGREIAREMRIDWSDSTATWAGKYVRSWMRAAGVATAIRERQSIAEGTASLFDD